MASLGNCGHAHGDCHRTNSLIWQSNPNKSPRRALSKKEAWARKRRPAGSSSKLSYGQKRKHGGRHTAEEGYRGPVRNHGLRDGKLRILYEHIVLPHRFLLIPSVSAYFSFSLGRTQANHTSSHVSLGAVPLRIHVFSLCQFCPHVSVYLLTSFACPSPFLPSTRKQKPMSNRMIALCPVICQIISLQPLGAW